jgi:hypothetical protein
VLGLAFVRPAQPTHVNMRTNRRIIRSESRARILIRISSPIEIPKKKRRSAISWNPGDTPMRLPFAESIKMVKCQTFKQ